MPLEARGTRACPDVAFFRPFADGNARASLPALTFVRARERVHPGEGLLRTTRHGDGAEAAAELALLVRILVRASTGCAAKAGPR